MTTVIMMANKDGSVGQIFAAKYLEIHILK